MRRARQLARLRGLYAIADGSSPHPPLTLVAAFVRAGAAAVQLRWKGAPAGELVTVARQAAAICAAAGVLFLVNDRPDVAALAGADGVHLGQDDVPPAAARAVLGEDALVGVSTHDDAEIAAALEAGADYLGFGPIFATASKPGAPLPAPHGPEGLAAAVRKAGRVPVVAIGGITAGRAPDVAAAGAACAAAIAELCSGGDPEGRARALAAAFSRGAPGG